MVTFHSLLSSAGWAAVFLGLVGTIAQYARAKRLGVEGVSLATWVLFVFMGCFWITYGAVSAHSWQVILGSLIILPIQLAIVFRLKPWRRWNVTVRCFAFFVVCCVIPTLLWGWAGGVLGTGIAMTANRGPQIVELVRHEDASGVSVSSWVLGVGGSVLWVGYYSGAHLWAALVSTLVAGIANLSIALLASWRHGQARRQLVAVEVFAD
jgi:uncharacterized protein with PQ loop repeat